MAKNPAITVAFISYDQPVKVLSVSFDMQLSGHKASAQTFNKVDAFEAKTGNEFILHVTLGRIDAKKATLEQVRRIAESIQVPSFTLLLQKAEYLYYKGKSIQRWTMNQNQYYHDRR